MTTEMSSIIENIPKPDFVCKPSSLRRANLNGFAALPDDIFLEISSHVPSDPITISAPSQAQIIRRKTLRSLSEVCQNLRRVFRPYLWQRVEVYVGKSDLFLGQKPKKDFAKELLRQLYVVTTQDPYLAQYVR